MTLTSYREGPLFQIVGHINNTILNGLADCLQLPNEAIGMFMLPWPIRFCTVLVNSRFNFNEIVYLTLFRSPAYTLLSLRNATSFVIDIFSFFPRGKLSREKVQ